MAGFEASRILLANGAKVVMLNRSVEKSTSAGKDLKEEFGASAEVGAGPKWILPIMRNGEVCRP